MESGWIKVSDCLPSITYNTNNGIHPVKLLIFNGYQKKTAYFAWNSYDDTFYWLLDDDDEYGLDEVTHWQYLPENPTD